MFGAARIHLPDPSCLNSAERAGAGRNVGRVNEQALRLMPGHREPRRLASSCVPFLHASCLCQWLWLFRYVLKRTVSGNVSKRASGGHGPEQTAKHAWQRKHCPGLKIYVSHHSYII